MMKSSMIVLGIVLLAASIFGAKLVLDQSATANHQKGDSYTKAPDFFHIWGHFDVEALADPKKKDGGTTIGVAQLNPRQLGDITFVAAENTSAEAGDLLLQVDDKLGQLQVDLAGLEVD